MTSHFSQRLSVFLIFFFFSNLVYTQTDFCPKKFTLLRDRTFKPVINNLVYNVELKERTQISLKEERIIYTPSKNICYCDYEIEAVGKRGNDEITTSLLFDGFVEFYWFPNEGDPALCSDFANEFGDGFNDLVNLGQDNLWTRYGDIDKLLTWSKVRRVAYPFGIMNAVLPDKDFEQNELLISPEATPGYQVLLSKAKPRSCDITNYIINSIEDEGLDPNAPTHNCTTGNMVEVDGVMMPECTLRAAIELNNRDYEGTDQTLISFDIPEEAGLEIFPLSPLPPLLYPLFIDASTSKQEFIVLDGSNAGINANGISINSELCSFYKLNIHNFDAHGIFATDFGSLNISNCIISKNLKGIVIKNGQRNIIHDNKIFENRSDGILINNDKNIDLNSATVNVISSNFIGNGFPSISNVGAGLVLHYSRGDRILNNSFFYNGKDQIQISNSDFIDIENNQVGISNVKGINLEFCKTVYISNNSISSNSTGIRLFNSFDAIIRSNDFYGSTKYGIRILDSSFRIFDNSINGVFIGVNGINISGYNSNGAIFSNSVFNQDKHGIVLFNTCRDLNPQSADCAAIRIFGNSIKKNKAGGLFLERAIALNHLNEILENSGSTGIHLIESQVYARGNLIEKDATDGVYVGPKSMAKLEFNNISDNTGFGVLSENPNSEVLAKNNWWGDPSGPGGIANGLGDEVSDFVIYSNWLTEPIGIIGAAYSDTILIPTNEFYDFEVFVQNWSELEDMVSVSASDEAGWLFGELSSELELNDSIAARTTFDVYTFYNDAQSLAEISFISSADPSNTDTLNVLLLSQERELNRIALLPDSVYLMPGDSVQFFFEGFDQFENFIPFDSEWTAPGGSIDDNGLYIAGGEGGTFTINLEDADSGINTQSIVIIEAPSNIVEDFVEKDYTIRFLELFPNPSENVLTLSLYANKSTKLKSYFLDLKGRKVTSKKFWNVTEGENRIELGSFKDLKPGYYLFLMEHRKKSYTYRVLKI